MPLFDLLKTEFNRTLVNYQQKMHYELTSEDTATINELEVAIGGARNGVQLRFYMEQRITTMPKTIAYYLPWTQSLRYDLEQVLNKDTYSLNHLLLDQNIELQEQNLNLQKEIGDLSVRLEAFQRMSVTLKDNVGQPTPYTVFDIARLSEQVNQLNETVVKQGEEIALVRGECSLYQKQAETLRKEKEVLAARIKQLEEQNAYLTGVNQEQAVNIQLLQEEKRRAVHTFEIVHPPVKKTPYPMKNCFPRNERNRITTNTAREPLTVFSP